MADPTSRYLARRRREAWLVPLAIAIIAGAALFGVGNFLWRGDARWLLLCAGFLLFPRQ